MPDPRPSPAPADGLLDAIERLNDQKDRLRKENEQLRELLGLSPGEIRAVVDEALSSRPLPAAGLSEALAEARPYVYNRTQGDDWRAQTARGILARVDAALESSGDG